MFRPDCSCLETSKLPKTSEIRLKGFGDFISLFFFFFFRRSHTEVYRKSLMETSDLDRRTNQSPTNQNSVKLASSVEGNRNAQTIMPGAKDETITRESPPVLRK